MQPLPFTKHFHLPSCLVIITTALVPSGVRVILFSKIVKQRLMRSRKWGWEQGPKAPRLEPLVVKKRQGMASLAGGRSGARNQVGGLETHRVTGAQLAGCPALCSAIVCICVCPGESQTPEKRERSRSATDTLQRAAPWAVWLRFQTCSQVGGAAEYIGPEAAYLSQ